MGTQKYCATVVKINYEYPPKKYSVHKHMKSEPHKFPWLRAGFRSLQLCPLWVSIWWVTQLRLCCSANTYWKKDYAVIASSKDVITVCGALQVTKKKLVSFFMDSTHVL